MINKNTDTECTDPVTLSHKAGTKAALHRCDPPPRANLPSSQIGTASHRHSGTAHMRGQGLARGECMSVPFGISKQMRVCLDSRQQRRHL